MEGTWRKKLRDAIKERRRHRYRLYLLDNHTVAKGVISPRRDQDAMDYATQEYEIGKVLFKEGVHVPEFYSLEKPDTYFSRVIRPQSMIKRPCIVMEKVPGEELLDLSEETLEEAISQHLKQLRRVLQAGVGTIDINGCNALFDEERKILHLVDFGGWYQDGKARERGELWLKRLEETFYEPLRKRAKPDADKAAFPCDNGLWFDPPNKLFDVYIPS